MSSKPEPTFDKSQLSIEEMELAVLDELCEHFRAGIVPPMYHHVLKERYGIDEKRHYSLFNRLISIGAITSRDVPGFADNRPYTSYSLSGNICEIAAQQRATYLANDAPIDLVESASRRARTHPVLARMIIGLLVATALATFVNQSLQFWKAVHAPPAAPTDEAK